MDRKTNISVSVKNRDRLAELGKKGDSYDDILGRVLDIIENLD